ncbi:MAG: dienelactone hydrolase family protein [Gammaproteobacteria bacterium]|uniref:Dienelactone hydrolase family n=1 Tax=Marinobacter nitratireducens TaxID=1137280 RepID=A0A072N0V7_9GAMM|nr:dienelactone hydrolase family protein [Marinobacter nitratireducens]KEF30867.1 Dienelactone hydrolase family [Marinobacter nitratireducens]TNE73415.1 MAG: dienelactone hydrolase family protein [Gammaproteobacteria bacterium]TNE95187.1 MAG: dienelactone hydrolase family protein [Gammaproteobacteria bacterium]
MKTLTSAAIAAFISMTTTQALAEMQTETVEYKVGDQAFTGYLAWDDQREGKRPGVLVVHEWWGHNKFARSQAEKLAEAGYTAFALDMYGSGKVADHPDTAKKFMEEATSDAQQIKTRFVTAMNILKNHDSVDGDRIAAQGYCFGGAVVLNMARLGVDLDGVVSYHGALGSPIKAEAGAVSAKVQVYTGGADKMVPSDQVAGLVKEMQDAGVDLTLVSFPGVMHSFTNPGADQFAEKYGMPVGYDEDAANRSWQGTMRFYEHIFSE